MAFPVGPVDGQQTTVNNITYQYSSTTNSWARVALAYSRSTSNTSPPPNPQVGDLWYNTASDVTYRWTFDGVNYCWIDYTGAATGISYTPSDTLSPFLLMGA